MSFQPGFRVEMKSGYSQKKGGRVKSFEWQGRIFIRGNHIFLDQARAKLIIATQK